MNAAIERGDLDLRSTQAMSTAALNRAISVVGTIHHLFRIAFSKDGSITGPQQCSLPSPVRPSYLPQADPKVMFDLLQA